MPDIPEMTWDLGCQVSVRLWHFAGKVNRVSPAIAPQQLGHGTPTVRVRSGSRTTDHDDVPPVHLGQRTRPPPTSAAALCHNRTNCSASFDHLQYSLPSGRCPV